MRLREVDTALRPLRPLRLLTMNIAYLILAHHQPSHLARLVRALEDPEAHFFIHIDKKSDLSPFQHLLVGVNNVVLIDDRVAVHWGGFSQVSASLKLLMRATQHGLPFRYYCLLSGSDFPLRHRREIQQQLRYPIQYLRVQQRLDKPEMNDGFGTHMAEYHFFDQLPLLCPHYRATSLWQRLARYFLSKLVDVANGCLPSRKYPTGFVPYHGSAWWCLTDDCIRYITRFVESNPEYVRFFRYAKSADEIFYHSIIKESPFAAYVYHDFERGTAMGDEHGSHHIIWRQEDLNSPKILVEADYPALIRSNALFARKFDDCQSRKLIALLERNMHK